MGYDPEKKSEYDRVYYLANKERIKQKNKEYRAKNIEVIKEKLKVYSKTPQSKARNKAYRSKPEHSMKKSEYDKKYREKHRDIILKKKKEYYNKNKDKIEAKMKVIRKTPEYREKHKKYLGTEKYKESKQCYDKKYLAEKHYGEYSECMILVEEIHKEVIKLVPDTYERQKMRGKVDRRIAKQMLKNHITKGTSFGEKWQNVLFLQFQ
jgi:hypothetical protein